MEDLIKWNTPQNINKINNISNLFSLEEETTIIKDQLVEDVQSHFENDEDSCKPIKLEVHSMERIWNHKVMTIDIKVYHQWKILIKLTNISMNWYLALLVKEQIKYSFEFNTSLYFLEIYRWKKIFAHKKRKHDSYGN